MRENILLHGFDPKVVMYYHVSITCCWCGRSEEHTSELQSRFDLVCRLLLEKKKMLDCDKPEIFAMSRVDQCVASFGLDSIVFTTTSATGMSLIFRRAPDRDLSIRPATPAA